MEKPTLFYICEKVTEANYTFSIYMIRNNRPNWICAFADDNYKLNKKKLYETIEKEKKMTSLYRFTESQIRSFRIFEVGGI